MRRRCVSPLVPSSLARPQGGLLRVAGAKLVAGLLLTCLSLSALLLAACGRDAAPNAQAGGATPESAGPIGPSFGAGDTERTWVGLLPCSDCQGVDTRLVLRVQGARRDYLMTETYLANEGGKRFSRAGAWTESHVAADGGETIVYQLDPERVGERFSLQPDGALELLDGDGKPPPDVLAYRLQRL